MNEKETRETPTKMEKTGGNGKTDAARQLREPTAPYGVAMPTAQMDEDSTAESQAFDTQSRPQAASENPDSADSDPIAEAIEVVLYRHAKAWKALAK